MGCGTLDYAYTQGFVKSNEVSATADALNKPINRYEMARIMVRITEQHLGEPKADTSNVSSCMADYNDVPSESTVTM